MKESNFSRWLLNNWFIGPDVHAQRIETTTGSGVPDMNICIRGQEFWVETKVETSRRILLRPFQHAWMTRRWQAGGRCFVVSLDTDNDVVLIHDHAKIAVEQYSKYLSVSSQPLHIVKRIAKNQQRFLDSFK